MADEPSAALAVGAAQHPVLIMNPWSGGGKANAEFAAAAQAARHRDGDAHPGRRPRAARPRRDRRGADVIGMAGGDGSQALVAGIASEHDVPFVCIPAGTRNHFALDLGVDRDDVVGALDAFVDGYERRVDLARVNGRVFVNNVSFGVYAAIVQSDEYRDAKLNTAAKMLPELLGSDYDPFDFELDGPDVDGRLRPRPHPRVEQRLQARGHRRARHAAATRRGRARRDRGRGAQRRRARAAGLALDRRSRSAYSGWHEWTTPTLEVRSGKPVDTGIDGEAVTLDSPVRLEVQPGALRVRIAPHHPGVSPRASPARCRRPAPRRLFQAAFGPDRARDHGRSTAARREDPPVSIVVSPSRPLAAPTGSGDGEHPPPWPIPQPLRGTPPTAVTGGATRKRRRARRIAAIVGSVLARRRGRADRHRHGPPRRRGQAVARGDHPRVRERRRRIRGDDHDRCPATAARCRPPTRCGSGWAATRWPDRSVPSLGTIAGATGVVQPYFDSRVSSGLADPGFFDWPDHATTEMARLDPEVVVFIIGTNDWTAVSGDWKDDYAAKVDSMMKTLIGPGRTVYWLGAPTLKDEKMDAAVVEVNAVAQDVAKRHPKVHYVDTYKLFSDTDGTFSYDLPDETARSSPCARVTACTSPRTAPTTWPARCTSSSTRSAA